MFKLNRTKQNIKIQRKINNHKHKHKNIHEHRQTNTEEIIHEAADKHKIKKLSSIGVWHETGTLR